MGGEREEKDTQEGSQAILACSTPNPPLSGQCAWIALHLVLLGAVNSGMVGGIGILFLPPPFRRSSGSWWRRKEMVSQFRKGQCSSGPPNLPRLFALASVSLS